MSKHTNLAGVVVGGMEKSRESVSLSGILEQEQKGSLTRRGICARIRISEQRVYSENSECD